MGVATIQAQQTFQFRVDPEAITYNYNLNTLNEDTYGGRVVQILSTTIDKLTVPCVSGSGGRAYLSQVAAFFKDMMIWQRDTQNTATFSYPPRQYVLQVYALSLSIDDITGNVTFPFTMEFRVIEDVGGFVSGDIVSAEINKLIDGIGYKPHTQYNDPLVNPPPPVPAYDPQGGEQGLSGPGGASGTAGQTTPGPATGQGGAPVPAFPPGTTSGGRGFVQ